MRTSPKAAFVLSIALWAGLLFAGAAARADERGPQGESFKSDMVIKNQETGEQRPMLSLGGDLGKKAAGGVEARLYVLQASSPDRFRTPGAPTHIFTVSLSEGGKIGDPLDETVSLRIRGNGADRKVALKAFEGKFHQGRGRLAEAGKYRVEVRFKAASGKSGSVTFPFEVVPPAGAAAAGGK